MNITLFAFIVWLALAFAGGVAVGALIIYKKEEDVLTGLIKQTADLALAERETRREREEILKTREMIDVIDNVPEYLRDKYYTNTTEEEDEEETNNGENPDEDIQIYM